MGTVRKPGVEMKRSGAGIRKGCVTACREVVQERSSQNEQCIKQMMLCVLAVMSSSLIPLCALLPLPLSQS